MINEEAHECGDAPPARGTDGFDLAEVAIAPDGRIAALDKLSLVEVFAP